MSYPSRDDVVEPVGRLDDETTTVRKSGNGRYRVFTGEN